MACDLPNINLPVVELLARWPGEGTVLPVIEGRTAPLRSMVGGGLGHGWGTDGNGRACFARSPRCRGVCSSDRGAMGPLVGAETFADCDSPSDLRRLKP